MMKLSVFVFLYIILHCIQAEYSPTQMKTGHCFKEKKHEVDSVIEDLKLERWSKTEETCYREMLSFLYGVKNRTLWATWVWDSIPRPTGTFYGSKHHLGGFDQCLKAPWANKHHGLRTQYCLAEIVMSKDGGKRVKELDPFGPMEKYFDSATEMNRKMNTIFYGICVPETCEESSVLKILKTFFANSHLSSLDAKFGIDNCQMSMEQYKYPLEFYAFIILFTTLITVSILATWCVKYKESDSLRSSITRAFCMKRNIKDLCTVNNSDLPSVNVIKTLLSSCVVCMHHYYFGFALATMNALDFDKLLSSPVGATLLNSQVGVDFFYAISGLLLMKGLMGKPKHPLKHLLSRYLRLVTPFAFMILYTVCVSVHIGSGPFWAKYANQENNNCRKNWLWSLLMLNNYVNDKEICQLTWWYIPTDFHVATIATLVIYLYKKNKVGNKFLAGIASILILIPGLVTYWNGYKSTPVYDVESLFNLRNNEIFLQMYMKTHNRMGPSVVGMITGYILATYKPNSFKNFISTKLTIAGMAASGLALCTIMASGDMMMKREYDALEAAIYASTYRVAWAVFVCVIVLLAEYGDLPILENLRQFPYFAIVNRLSYSIYLTHTAFIQRRWYSSRNPYFFEVLAMFMDGTGVLVYTMVGSFILWLFVEAPMAHITNIIVNSRPVAVETSNENTSEKPLLPRQVSFKLMKIGS